LPRLRVALFDMDGTIFDSRIDLNGIRHDLGLPRDGRGILEQLAGLPAEVRARGLASLLEAEAQCAASGGLIPGTAEILSALHSRGMRCALVTNNSRASLQAMITRFPLPFDLTLSRDDGPTKPSPELFRIALDRLAASPEEAVSLGDTHLDVLAAHAAGIAAIVLVSPQPWLVGFIPGSISYKRATDLYEALRVVESLLDQCNT